MPGFSIGQGERLPSNTVETHRSHRWRIQSMFGLDLNQGGSLLYVKSTTIPELIFTTEEILVGNFKHKFASEAGWNDVRITFYDAHGLYDELKKIQGNIWDPESGIKPANNYVDQVQINQEDGSGNTIDYFRLVNAWPESVTHGTLSYDDTSIKLVDVNVKYSWATHEHNS